VLTSYAGWRHSLLGITEYNGLPEKLKEYLAAIERETGVPIAAVSISPDRRDVLFKQVQ
jgi:adenylosuccinate synthase